MYVAYVVLLILSLSMQTFANKLKTYEITDFHNNIYDSEPSKALTKLLSNPDFAFTRNLHDKDAIESVLDKLNVEKISNDGVSEYKDLFFELINQHIKESYSNSLRGKSEEKIVKLIDKKIKNKNKRKFCKFLLDHASYINAQANYKKRVSISQEYLKDQLISGNREDLLIFVKDNREMINNFVDKKTGNNALFLILRGFSDKEKDTPLIKEVISIDTKQVVKKTTNDTIFSIADGHTEYRKYLYKLIQSTLKEKEISKLLAVQFGNALDQRDYPTIILLFMEHPQLVHYVGKSGRTILYFINKAPEDELKELRYWVNVLAPGLKESIWSMSF